MTDSYGGTGDDGGLSFLDLDYAADTQVRKRNIKKKRITARKESGVEITAQNGTPTHSFACEIVQPQHPDIRHTYSFAIIHY